MKAVVIGGGFSGLATASLLSRQGIEVTLVEKNNTLGGRARVLEEKGYKFDMGPSWYLMPEVFDCLFSSIGKRRPYELVKLSPSFKLTIDWKKDIVIYPDMSDNKEELNKLEENGFEKMERYLEYTRFMYETAMKKFLYREYSAPGDLFTREVMGEAVKLGLFSSLESFNKRFFKSEDMLKLTGFASVFLGGSPDVIPGLYALVNYPIFGQGVFYPKGGFGKIVEGLVGDYDVRLGEEVVKAKVKDRKVYALKTNKGEVDGDLFVFSGDYRWLDQNVLPVGYSNYDEGYWDTRVYAPSAVLAFVGIRDSIDEPHHHIVIRGDWKKHFSAIFNNSPLPEGLSYYVSIRSKSEQGLAPEGGDSLFFLIPLPPGFNGDSESIAKKVVFEYLEKHGIREVDYIRFFTPREFRLDYNATLGTAFGLAHTLSQTALFRPSMRNRRLSNLLYTGQYTHPGIGVPMVIISAQVATQIVVSQLKE
ncbi:phytoene desaturase family protein [Stygiolobus caldivivus]|uniref:Phytoene dehydrogenase n=1 Tax=Stygiolobus caldivivus TaxID=2824673 RepID=A0A8D5ZII5_9CREN|nr:phytoene desaturase family protein [Stygiolobus caldivivus]BCU69646.1 phytoene dehydrogenase [Stygiolobus caldivivus]